MKLISPDIFACSNTLMIQGCTSDAGKTIMVAGLCRVLARLGKSVVPFKPQNMALNSAVTKDGGEIGRAQALQAQACFLEPHTDMNPILLKPSSDVGAQVIVHGKAVDSMQAVQFHDYKKVAMQAVLESHQRLDENYDIIVVEGAGSPAEINLRTNDIANMGFAEAVDCPVIIIADIDKGGVFAHLVGTLELLSQSEQDRVIGFVINRFRGDIKLLEPGLEWLEQRTSKPVLGVIPYLHDLFLDAEDAIDAQQVLADNEQAILKVVVPVLPRISNHTDFDVLRMHPQVDLQFVSIEQPCPACDLIILPGSKNVIADLTKLKNNNWHDQLHKHLRYGGKVIGICGGYQMLGRHVTDPTGVESNGQQSTIDGFNLLLSDTTLEPEKQLKQVSGHFIKEGFEQTNITGYEIHCGITTFESPALFKLSNGQKEGTVNADNNVLGTYLHGLFDQPQACKVLMKWAGLDSGTEVSIDTIREQQLERLADCLENNLNSDFLHTLKAMSGTKSAAQEAEQCKA